MDGNVQSPWVAPGQLTSIGTHYILQGRPEDQLVVCIHGVGSYHFHFDKLAAVLLKNNYRVLRYDLIGRGFSKPSDSYDRKAHLEQLDTLLKEIGLADCPRHVIGHSMGGAVALLHVDQHPGLTLSPTLLSPAGLMSGAIFSVLRGLSCLHNAISNSLKNEQERAWRKDFFSQDAATVAVRESSVERLRCMHANNPHAHYAFFQSVLHFPLSGLRQEVSRVAARPGRILLLWGDHDTGVPVSNLARWRAALGAPGTKVTLQSDIIPDSAHAFFLERPDRTHRLIMDFLAGGGGGGGGTVPAAASK